MYFEIERIKRILEELEEQIYCDKREITEIFIKPCEYGEYDLINENNGWEKFKVGDRWGGADKHSLFKFDIEIPVEFDGKPVMFELKTGMENEWDATNPQFILYINNELIQGLDVNHREVPITNSAKAKGIYNISLYAYGGKDDKKAEFLPTIAIYNLEVDKLFNDVRVPLEVAELLNEDDKRRIDILNYLTNTINMLDLRKPFTKQYFESIEVANQYLETEFYEKYCYESDIVETCIGHTHIDVAWLWTLAQTREKTVRSFSTVLNLMNQYPNYKFMSSQPQLYKFLKEEQPQIYEKVKEKIKIGQWEAEGAMWLEADCNVTSGESLVRQIVYGKKFFYDEFNVESKILWLPDVFGYSAALPQILRKSDVDYFMTTKISWNEYNTMPYDTFNWQGIDGTSVLTHFVTTRDYNKDNKKDNFTTYNGDTSPLQVMGGWQRYQQKNINNEILNTFGFGDGGGGPTRKMLENVQRLEKGIPGAPTVRIGTALDFFERLEERVKDNRHLPKWVGELYLEYHRGTYTSMARNKKANRKSEYLNLDAELFATMLNSIDKGFVYPKNELDECWETTLLNQFHDIIPGSSIKQVYEDSDKDYARIKKIGNEIVSNALKNYTSKIDLKTTSVVVYNTLGFERSDLVTVKLPKEYTFAKIFDGDKEIASQITKDNELIFFADKVPSKGHKSFEIRKVDEEPNYEDFGTVSEKEIDTTYFKLKLNDVGEFVSIFDKVQNREVLKPGERGNVIQAFEDKPHNFDAWDINIYYQEKMWEVNDVVYIKVVENGPVRKTLEIKREFLDSVIIQKISVYSEIARIDFASNIDWKETQILLKTAFPVDVLANKATYEIQYGNVERPTHWNTSWDYARFEVCSHKWADISEDNFGVSLLNDCKYGHDIKDSNMRLTMLKSAKDPNEDADREIHNFTYSLYPHKNDFRDGGVVQMAYNLNCPMYAVVEDSHNGEISPIESFVSIDAENVFVEVVKKAEESEHIIVRLYECYNRRTNVNCMFNKKIKSVYECNLLERNTEQLTSDDNAFSFEINPFEIKTFKIELQ